jgi:hypothetical protein
MTRATMTGPDARTADAFLREHGEALAHNLGADTWRAARDLCAAHEDGENSGTSG